MIRHSLETPPRGAARMPRAAIAAALLSGSAACGQSQVVILPTLPNQVADQNMYPFGFTAGNAGITLHQVFASTLFGAATPGSVARIDRLAFAPTASATFAGHLTIRLGYTAAVPAQLPSGGGLMLPDINGEGVPNALRPMHLFCSSPTSHAATSPHAANFAFTIDGAPFHYDPSRGNLLVEVMVTEQTSGFPVSVALTSGSGQASRTYRRINGETGIVMFAQRTQFTYTIVPRPCFANCDESTVQPSSMSTTSPASSTSLPRRKC